MENVCLKTFIIIDPPHRQKSYKKQLLSLLFPISLRLVSAMMSYKPLPVVPLVVAFSAASSVTVAASVNPVARGNDGGYPPPDCEPISQSQCDMNSVQCCNTYTSADNPVVGLLSGVLGIVLDTAAGVGVSCVGVVGGTQW